MQNVCCLGIHINRAEEVWLMIMDNVTQNEKLMLLLDYFVEQWLPNQIVPFKMLNMRVNMHSA
jgi:hypothetical protein